MAFGLGTGQESVIGFGEETAYGTRTAPTDFIPFVNESLKHQRNLIADPASLGDPLRTYPVRIGASTGGNIVFEPWIAGIEAVLKYSMGDHFTTTNPTTGVYQHKFRIGRAVPSYKSAADPSFTSLTCDVYRGSWTAAGYVYGHAGMLLNGLRLDLSAGGPGRMTCGALFFDTTEVASPTTVALDNASLPFPTRTTVGLADPTTGTATYTDVTAFSASFDVPGTLAQEFPLGLNGGVNYPLALQPHRSANVVKVTGSFQCLAGISSRSFGTTIGTLRNMEQTNQQVFVRYQFDNSSTTLGYTFGHTVEFQDARIVDIGPEVSDAGNIKRTVMFEAFTPSSTAYQFANVMQWTVTNGRSGFLGR